MQTVALDKALSDSITVVDTYPEYLDQLKERASSRGVAESIEILVTEMYDFPFPDQSFDMIWSEGAAYNMGFENALVDWRRFLKSGGCLAATQLVWLPSDPSSMCLDSLKRISGHDRRRAYSWAYQKQRL